ncbi:putative nucleotide-binding protein (sugar kinase/HSP70/actin superfamily) [Caldicoprobacter guelmensis]|uniref:acyl-CoA dehydratase activase-related protein n=1 Tax=Caldicoprobacter guelmensis TaxID=1170224 RepID=UPI00195954CA|nr:acyl-CoA dehydratase activase-related protein [Caldicoprobacter guelmensis]MBM7581653.1 putative nucleotide-binding protein (sugar kinase/HSP70/actin superfamily) [Caldicoprobacter guelmensis]
MKIGLPRALLYYNYYPLWHAFFEELGCQVVTSSTTSKSTLDRGVMNCVDDACLPIKLFHGHVVDLIGRADAVFIPRLVSICPGEYICPKFIGLPEMIKSSIKGLPELLVLNYNAHRNHKDVHKPYIELGKIIGVKPSKVMLALQKATEKQQAYEMLLRKGQTPLDILKGRKYSKKEECKGIIGLIGHPYLLYDEFISMGIISKLRNRGYDVLVPENIEQSQIEMACSQMPKKLFWSYGKKLLGSGLTMLEEKKVVGIVFLSSFGCGIDAFIVELLQRYNHRQYRIPSALITVDEHSGQAGFDTRLEAFIDMVEWRDEREGYVPPYGTSIFGY